VPFYVTSWIYVKKNGPYEVVRHDWCGRELPPMKQPTDQKKYKEEDEENINLQRGSIFESAKIDRDLLLEVKKDN
jgi:hypothetical protein